MKISHVVRTLVLSDFFINSGFSLFAPLFAVFITRQVAGGSIQIVGFAAAVTQIFKVGLQIPIAHFLDKNHGEFDDFYSLVMGSSISALVPFLYLFVHAPLHVYIVQAIYGIGLAMAVPPWAAIFTRHIDHQHENLEWSFESVAIGVSGAISAALGGIIAQRMGFQTVFIMGGILAIFGASFQILIFKDLRAKVPRGQVKPVPDTP